MGHGEIKNDKARISLVIPKDLKAEIDRRAKAEDRSMSYIIVAILKKALSTGNNGDTGTHA